jgi:hypothetical protein
MSSYDGINRTIVLINSVGLMRKAMPDGNQPNQKRARKPEKFVQDSLPDSGVPPQKESKPRNRKRGFYARAFTRLEVTDLDVLNQEKLLDEIALLRVAMRRCFEAASSMEPTDSERWAKVLSALGGASTRLAGLLRSQQVLAEGGDGSFLAILSTALTQVRKEMNI